MKQINNFSKGFVKLDKLLPISVNNHKLRDPLYRYRALKHWREIAGSFVEGAKSLTVAVDLNKGVLVVACLSRELAEKIKSLERQIISALNQFLGRAVVFSIYLEL